MSLLPYNFFFFFFNDTATTEIYTLSLHDALPISIDCAVTDFRRAPRSRVFHHVARLDRRSRLLAEVGLQMRSEEHTSELQSRLHLVCRLLLEKKKKKAKPTPPLNEPTLPRPHNGR